MGYLRNRFKQPSSWMGIVSAALALSASGGVYTAEVGAALLAALGLFHINEEAAK